MAPAFKSASKLKTVIGTMTARHVRLFGTTEYAAEIDLPTRALRTIGEFNAQVHEGRAFEFGRIFRDVVPDATVALLFVVNSDINLHAALSVKSTGQGELSLYEDPVITDNGTEVTPRNRNRKITTPDIITGSLFSGPTISSYGTLLSETTYPGGATGTKTGGIVDLPSEWIFKAGGLYLLEAVNTASTNADITISVAAYESPAGSLGTANPQP